MNPISRRTFLLAGAGTGAGLLASLTLGSTLLWADNRTSLTILGAGRGLSVLLSSSGIRVLLLNGDDPSDFANAFASARNPMFERIDLVLVPSATSEPGFVRQSLRRIRAQTVYSLGESRALLDAGIGITREVLMPWKLDLSEEMSLTIDPETIAAESGQVFWTGRVSLGGHEVLIDGSSKADRVARSARAPSAWIRAASGVSQPAIQQIDPKSLFVAADLISGPELRGLLAGSGYGYRVHPGEQLRIETGTRGLTLPDNPASEPSPQ